MAWRIAGLLAYTAWVGSERAFGSSSSIKFKKALFDGETKGQTTRSQLISL